MPKFIAAPDRLHQRVRKMWPAAVVGGCLLIIAALASGLACQAGEMKKSTTDAQVAVLLRWYHDYSTKGRYEQAYRVAELAHEMAPENPETVVALKIASRQRNAASSAANAEQKLEKILTKLEQIEKRLHALEAKKQQSARTRIPYREPPGSPDSIYSLGEERGPQQSSPR